MNIEEKWALLRTVTHRYHNLHFMLLADRVVGVFGGPTPLVTTVVDRLDVALLKPEGLSDDANTLYVGANGILSIVEHLMQGSTSHTIVGRKLRKLFPDCAFMGEMIRATVRAATGRTAAGEAEMHRKTATAQLSDWSDGHMDVEVVRQVDR